MYVSTVDYNVPDSGGCGLICSISVPDGYYIFLKGTDKASLSIGICEEN